MRGHCSHFDTVPLFEDHNEQNIAECFKDILANWGLTPDNLVVTTTNNGLNYVAGLRILEWTRLSCYGHNLNLSINKSLTINRIQQAIKKCHALINRSWIFARSSVN